MTDILRNHFGKSETLYIGRRCRSNYRHIRTAFGERRIGGSTLKQLLVNMIDVLNPESVVRSNAAPTSAVSQRASSFHAAGTESGGPGRRRLSRVRVPDFKVHT